MNYIFQTSELLIRDDGMYRTLLIVQTHKKDQKQPSGQSCTELSKIQFFLVNIVNM